jgi:AcrR family transcriptional regulator
MSPRPAAKTPLQERSRRSETKLLAAARRILARRGFDQVSVAEIARSAGLTVGGFYSRFDSKEALLARLERDVFEDTRRVIAALAARAAQGADAVTLLRDLVENHVRLYRDNSAVVRALVLRSRNDPELTEELRELSRQNFAAFARALAASGAVRHPRAELALEFALYAERSVLREAVLFGEGWGKERRWSDAEIVDETVRLVASYLGLALPAALDSPASGAPPRRSSRTPGNRSRSRPTNEVNR